jgi:hypothetical protein
MVLVAVEPVPEIVGVLSLGATDESTSNLLRFGRILSVFRALMG